MSFPGKLQARVNKPQKILALKHSFQYRILENSYSGNVKAVQL
jgi:hypothetical protein